MKNLKLVVLAAALAAASACKKQPDPAPAAGSGSAVIVAVGSGSAVVVAAATDVQVVAVGSGSGAGSAVGSAAAGSGSAADPAADTGNWVKVYATHNPTKPGDPVEILVPKLTVVKSSFDPAKLEGGTAELALDLTSLKSDSKKRDEDLNTPAYIDTAKFATAKIEVSDVKKTGDKTYTANAKVSLRALDKTYPVTFEVVDSGPDWVRVVGSQDISRGDFKVGAPDKVVENILKVKLQLTLKKA